MIEPAELFSVRGRSALVTGASSGIGRMIATGFANAGATVYACARTVDRLEQAAAAIRKETRGRCVPVPGDVSTLDGIKALVAAVGKQTQGLDILVNNAGTLCDAPLDDYPESGWDDVVDLSLKSAFFMVQQCLPLLRERGTPARPSTVINIGSVGGLRVGPRETYAYAAAKAGLHHLSKSLAKRLGPENITVNSIAPGFFPSEMTRIESEEMHKAIVQMIPRRRVGEPEDVAGLAIFLASRAGTYLTGAVVPLEGGMSL